MLSCEHEKEPFGEPLCSHLRTCKQPWIKFVKWYVGSGLTQELICVPCADAREKGLSTEAAVVCQECFEYATTEVMDFERVGGRPEIRIQPTTLKTTLEMTALPEKFGKIVDIASISTDNRSAWLILSERGRIFRFDASSGESADVASVKLTSEVAETPFAGHVLAPHLHSSGQGEFASVVNDYGRYGQVIDLQTGKVTLNLDAGDYHPETVPFSFAFVRWQERVVVIHRTAWNRLDVSEASTGHLLSDRPTSYRTGEQRPQHYLDYFHGGLYLSPSGTHILDDGWVWHPVGIPAVWSVDCWLSENDWESEDGPTRKEVCARSYYWDHGIVWLDDETLAIAGIGDDDAEMIDGARIFDITSTGSLGRKWRSDWPWRREITKFAGPAGKFFASKNRLYSSVEAGLSMWDVEAGARTGHIPNFHPTHHHRGARELVQLRDGILIRWSIPE